MRRKNQVGIPHRYENGVIRLPNTVNLYPTGLASITLDSFDCDRRIYSTIFDEVKKHNIKGFIAKIERIDRYEPPEYTFLESDGLQSLEIDAKNGVELSFEYKTGELKNKIDFVEIFHGAVYTSLSYDEEVMKTLENKVTYSALNEKEYEEVLEKYYSVSNLDELDAYLAPKYEKNKESMYELTNDIKTSMEQMYLKFVQEEWQKQGAYINGEFDSIKEYLIRNPLMYSREIKDISKELAFKGITSEFLEFYMDYKLEDKVMDKMSQMDYNFTPVKIEINERKFEIEAMSNDDFTITQNFEYDLKRDFLYHEKYADDKNMTLFNAEKEIDES